MRRTAASLLLAFLFMLLARVADAQILSLVGGPTRDIRNEALRAIPFDRLKDETRRRLTSVIQNPTIHRRIPVKSIDCDPDMYLFLIRNPEVVVNMWQLMGITSVDCRRVGAYAYEGTDGAGTTARMDLIYGSKDMHVFLADGQHTGAVFKRNLDGKCVLILRSNYQGPTGPDTRVASQLDYFLQLDNIGADLVARSIQPLVGSVAESNFNESLNFVSQMSRAAAQKGDGVEQIALRLNKVEPRVRDEFVTVSRNVHLRTINQNVSDRNEEAARIVPAALPMSSDAEGDSDAPEVSLPAVPARGKAASRLRR